MLQAWVKARLDPQYLSVAAGLVGHFILP